MNLSTVKTFLAIAQTGQLNRAAQQLNVTQSTVTARLNALEEEMGQMLFHRKKSGAQFTSAGFRFHRYAQLMVDVWRQAQQETSLSPSVSSVFNFGCHPDLWPFYGDNLLQQVSEQEEIAVSAWSADHNELERWLTSGLIDAALYYSPVLNDDRREYLLFTERRVLVSKVKRPLMRWDPNYIYVDGGETFRKDHAAAYPGGGTPLKTISSSVWAKESLLKHGGSGYMPVHLIQAELAIGDLYLVDGAPDFSRNVYLVVNKLAQVNWDWFDSLLEGIRH